MTSIEEHQKIAKEFLEDIEEKIRLNLVGRRQKIIGFSVSEASTNLFAAFLHKKNLIEPGFNINHQFFTPKNCSFRMLLCLSSEIGKAILGCSRTQHALCFSAGFLTSERKAKEIFSYDFDKKEKIIEILSRIENLRTKLCYGRDKELSEVNIAIKLLYELKRTLEELGND